MGADLISYIVVAPAKIPEEGKKKAAKKLLEIAREARRLKTWECALCGDVLSEASLKNGHCDDCGETVFDPRDIKTISDAKALINTWVNPWPPDYRDVSARGNPDNPKEVIICAGELSWGDEPQGRGFQTLKTILNSGVSNELGLR